MLDEGRLIRSVHVFSAKYSADLIMDVNVMGVTLNTVKSTSNKGWIDIVIMGEFNVIEVAVKIASCSTAPSKELQ